MCTLNSGGGAPTSFACSCLVAIPYRNTKNILLKGKYIIKLIIGEDVEGTC